MTAPAQALEALNEALEILENALEPLFEKKLSETIDDHEQLEQAKLCAMIPYIVNELIITYLRTRGIPPSTHPVNAEVDRIKTYFRKIATAENPDKTIPRESDQHLQLDKAAADRFIRAALAEANRGAKYEVALPSDTIPGLPAQAQKASPPQRLDEQPSEGGTYSRFSRIVDTADENREDESSSESMSGIELELRQNTVPELEKKRKRPAIDPFTGYVEPVSKKAKKKDRSKSKASSQKAAPAQGDKDMVSKRTTPIHEQVEDPTKPKKARKKSKKK